MPHLRRIRRSSKFKIVETSASTGKERIFDIGFKTRKEALARAKRFRTMPRKLVGRLKVVSSSTKLKRRIK